MGGHHAGVRQPTAAWRPVCPPSRRWEKNMSRLQEVHWSMISISEIPAIPKRAEIIFPRSSRPGSTDSSPAKSSLTSGPTSKQQGPMHGPITA